MHQTFPFICVSKRLFQDGEQDDELAFKISVQRGVGFGGIRLSRRAALRAGTKSRCAQELFCCGEECASKRHECTSNYCGARSGIDSDRSLRVSRRANPSAT